LDGYDLCAQALTAFGAASVDDAATTNGSHARTKTMAALADDFTRLISPFHWKNLTLIDTETMSVYFKRTVLITSLKGAVNTIYTLLPQSLSP
jgi:hypothetical protein